MMRKTRVEICIWGGRGDRGRHATGSQEKKFFFIFIKIIQDRKEKWRQKDAKNFSSYCVQK